MSYNIETLNSWVRDLDKSMNKRIDEIRKNRLDISKIKDYVEKRISQLTSIEDSCELSSDPEYEVSIYFIRCLDSAKVGYSKHPNSRLLALQTANPNKLEMIGYFAGNKFHEQKIHQDLEKYRQSGEWFSYCEDVQKYIQKELESKKFKPMTPKEKSDRTRIVNNIGLDKVLKVAREIDEREKAETK
jgi:hypothetical protein